LTHFYARLGKRLFDFCIAATALVLLVPALILVAILVRATLGRPILFRQKRPGLNGKSFVIFKFRTMLQRDNAGDRATDLDRLEGPGRFLRATSLDELPQLINVLKGDMSLVGPRPLLMHYLGRYTPAQARRHEVKPGLTGWAQINGRNELTWDDKLALDVWYVDHHSFWLDLKILARTVECVARRRGINGQGDVPVREFLGSAR
jgi:lipopolysaccharide/colanic/teichoic acid biosynthesis glycosyltransferase